MEENTKKAGVPDDAALEDLVKNPITGMEEIESETEEAAKEEAKVETAVDKAEKIKKEGLNDLTAMFGDFEE